LLGGGGTKYPPFPSWVTPEGGTQLLGGLTPAGISAPGMTTLPFGKTVVPTGRFAVSILVPGGSVMPGGTITSEALVTVAGRVTPAGSLVPGGR
jgi:hypothetical protein